MQKKLLLILVLFISLPVFVSAQYGNKIRHRGDNSFVNKRYRNQRFITAAFGASNFLGELGGANQIGTFFVKDLEISTTRPSAALGYRYKFNQRIALSGGLHYLAIKGNDNLTTEPFRQNRNLNFKTNIWELSIQGELYFTKEQQGHLYRIKNAKGRKSYKIQVYAFGGVGVFYFNPKALYRNKWVALQPLGTEGQGLEGGPKKYTRFSICIPYGIGISEGIGKNWTVGVEFGIRKTFTDYIDDVSGEYFDNAAIAQENGATAAALADPSINHYPASLGGDATGYRQSAAGEQRGDPTHKDAYMFTNITVTYKLKAKRSVRSKF